MEAQLIVRLDPDLKAKMQRLAQAEGKSASQVIRELIENYTRERDMSGHIDDLWNRIGGKLESRGLGPEDVERAIQDVRAGKR